MLDDLNMPLCMRRSQIDDLDGCEINSKGTKTGDLGLQIDTYGG